MRGESRVYSTRRSPGLLPRQVRGATILPVAATRPQRHRQVWRHSDVPRTVERCVVSVPFPEVQASNSSGAVWSLQARLQERLKNMHAAFAELRKSAIR